MMTGVILTAIHPAIRTGQRTAITYALISAKSISSNRSGNIWKTSSLHRSGGSVPPECPVPEIRGCGIAKCVQFRMDALLTPDPALVSLQDLARIKKRVVSAGGWTVVISSL